MLGVESTGNAGSSPFSKGVMTMLYALKESARICAPPFVSRISRSFDPQIPLFPNAS